MWRKATVVASAFILDVVLAGRPEWLTVSCTSPKVALKHFH